MAYNWAQLAFVEKWRLQAVRGLIIGMYRPADKTYFDIRLRPGEGNVGAIPGTMELHLQDAGDIIREKRIGLLARAAVVVRVVARPSTEMTSDAPRPKRPLEAGSTLSGTLMSLEGDEGLLDAGYPLVVQFESQPAGVEPGQTVKIAIAEAPRGFLVV